MSINWNNIRAIDGQREGFEELVCQLAGQEKIDRQHHFVRIGKPDGGKECYWELSNHKIHCWQAKYFVNSLSNNQWSQVDKSVKTAIDNHPTLEKYYIAIPVDRPDGKGRGKSMLQKWKDHITDWKKYAASRELRVSFEYWGKHELETRLRRKENEGLVYYFFNESELTDKWFDSKNQESIDALGDRYTPELSFRQPFFRFLDGFDRDSDFEDQFNSQYEEVLKMHHKCDLSAKQKVLKGQFTTLSNTVNELKKNYESITLTGVDLIPIQSIKKNLNKISEAIKVISNQLNEWKGHQEKTKKKKGEITEYGFRASSDELSDIRELKNAINKFHDFLNSEICALANNPCLLILGPAGIGKSHSLADLVEERKQKGETSLLLLGENFSTNELPWTQILRNQLRIEGNEDVFLGALSAKAESQHSRIILIIDALNEGNGEQVWPRRLKSIIRSFQSYPWLGLIVSLRDSFEELIAPEDDVGTSITSRVNHPGFEGIEYEASNHFFSHYNIVPPSSPQLHPKFRNPLFLKLFCEGLAKIGLTQVPERYQGVSEIIEHENATEDATLLPEQSDRNDWGDAPHVSDLFGRKEEISILETSIVGKKSKLFLLLGKKGIGKTALSIKFSREICKDEFKFIIWRSLLTSNSDVMNILENFIKFLSNQQERNIPNTIEERIKLLLTYLKKYRCLLILDNVESILQGRTSPGNWFDSYAGEYKEGYEGYDTFFKEMCENSHQSCLLLTSREKPHTIEELEATSIFAHVLPLKGISYLDAREIFKKISPSLSSVENFSSFEGSSEQWKELVEFYDGNPFALKNIVAFHIASLFSGDVAQFLKDGKKLFHGLKKMLDWYFKRLSDKEQEIMYWLAINLESVPISEIQQDLVSLESKEDTTSTLQSLQRRLLLEKTNLGFTLQPIFIEYIIEKLIEHYCQGLLNDKFRYINDYALIKASSKDYIRENQTNTIIKRIVDRMSNKMNCQNLRTFLLFRLSILQEKYSQTPGYAAGNILNLLCYLKSDLSDCDFSHLTIWQAYLQGIALHDTNFSYTNLKKSSFNETFGLITCVEFSKCENLLSVGDSHGLVYLLDAKTGELLETYRGHQGWVRCVSFSPDGTKIISGSTDHTVRLWNVINGKHIVIGKHTAQVRTVAFSHCGSYVASGGEDGVVQLWRKNGDGFISKHLNGYGGQIWAVVFRFDDQVIASGSEDSNIRLWCVKSGKCLETLGHHSKRIKSLSFNSKGILASGSDDETIVLYDTIDKKKLKEIKHPGFIRCVKFGGNDTFATTSEDDNYVLLWNITKTQWNYSLSGHTRPVQSVSFAPEKNLLASGGNDQTLRLWDTNTGQCLKTIKGYSNEIWDVAFCPKKGIIATGGFDQVVRLWDLDKENCFKTLPGHNRRVASIAFDPGGKILASGSYDQTIKIWDYDTGQCLHTLRGHTNRVKFVNFNSDGRKIVSASEDCNIIMWNSATGERVRIFQGHDSPVCCTEFNNNEKMLASGSEDCTIRIWDIASGEGEIFGKHNAAVRSVAFHPSKSLLVSGSEDMTIKIWNVESKQCIKTLTNHKNRIWSVIFICSGEILASASADKTVILWSTANWKVLRVLDGHTDQIRSLSYNSDENVIASAGNDGTIRIWDVESGDCKQILRIEKPYERMNITGIEGLTNTQTQSLKDLGAIDHY